MTTDEMTAHELVWERSIQLACAERGVDLFDAIIEQYGVVFNDTFPSGHIVPADAVRAIALLRTAPSQGGSAK